MLQVNELCKKFGAKNALSDISFSLERNEVLGFLGPNGAGKSTAMNIIAGYLAPSAGSVFIDGHNIMDEPFECKKMLGWLPEKAPLYSEMTVHDYLAFVFDLKSIKLPKKQHIDETLEKTGLTEVRNRLIKNLSKGYGQRVGLAQCLLGKPSLLMLDEPTVGLDPTQIPMVRSIIKEAKKEQAVLFSSHILSEVEAVADRILIINQGRILSQGKTKDMALSTGLKEDASLEDVFLKLVDKSGQNSLAR